MAATLPGDNAARDALHPLLDGLLPVDIGAGIATREQLLPAHKFFVPTLQDATAAANAPSSGGPGSLRLDQVEAPGLLATALAAHLRAPRIFPLAVAGNCMAFMAGAAPNVNDIKHAVRRVATMVHVLEEAAAKANNFTARQVLEFADVRCHIAIVAAPGGALVDLAMGFSAAGARYRIYLDNGVVNAVAQWLATHGDAAGNLAQEGGAAIAVSLTTLYKRGHHAQVDSDFRRFSLAVFATFTETSDLKAAFDADAKEIIHVLRTVPHCVRVEVRELIMPREAAMEGLWLRLTDEGAGRAKVALARLVLSACRNPLFQGLARLLEVLWSDDGSQAAVVSLLADAASVTRGRPPANLVADGRYTGPPLPAGLPAVANDDGLTQFVHPYLLPQTITDADLANNNWTRVYTGSLADGSPRRIDWGRSSGGAAAGVQLRSPPPATMQWVSDHASEIQGALLYLGGSVAKNKTFVKLAKKAAAKDLSRSAKKLDEKLGITRSPKQVSEALAAAAGSAGMAMRVTPGFVPGSLVDAWHNGRVVPATDAARMPVRMATESTCGAGLRDLFPSLFGVRARRRARRGVEDEEEEDEEQ